MRRVLFGFVLVVSFVSAASLSTTAICDDVVVTGTTSADCGNPLSTASFATATAGPGGVAAQAGIMLAEHFGSALASFADAFVLTITGGAVQGLFMPCLSVGKDGLSITGATASFNGATIDAGGFPRSFGINSCEAAPGSIVPLMPYTRDERIIADVSLSATADSFPIFGGTEAGAFASCCDFEFFDTSMNRLSDVTFTFTEVPEPSEALLLICGLLIVVELARRVNRRPA